MAGRLDEFPRIMIEFLKLAMIHDINIVIGQAVTNQKEGR
jgi:hypothetical protein